MYLLSRISSDLSDGSKQPAIQLLTKTLYSETTLDALSESSVWVGNLPIIDR